LEAAQAVKEEVQEAEAEPEPFVVVGKCLCFQAVMLNFLNTLANILNTLRLLRKITYRVK